MGATGGAPAARAAAATPGTVSTSAGGGNENGYPALGAYDLGENAVPDASGNLFVAAACAIDKVDSSGILHRAVYGNGKCLLSGDGGPAASAGMVANDLAFDAAGNLFVADTSNNRIRRIDHATGVVTTVAGSGTAPAGGQGGFGGDGGPATSALLLAPYGIALDAAGDVYIDDAGNNRIRKVAQATGVITTLAGTGTAGFSGDGGPAFAAQLGSFPTDVAADSAGDVFIADGTNNRIRRVDHATGIITTVAGSGATGYRNGGYGGDGGPATSALLSDPADVEGDPSGNLFIADYLNGRLRKVDTQGIISTVAGGGPPAFIPDGAPATSGAFSPSRIMTFGASGEILLGDDVGQSLRRISASGIVTTIAGGGLGDGDPSTAVPIIHPYGVAASGSSYYFTTGAETVQPQVVRMVDTYGVIHTVAGDFRAGNKFSGDGGPATKASLNNPKGLAVDPGGNLLIAECGNLAGGRVRRVSTGGVISTVAGGGSPPDGVGDSGPATSAALGCPTGLYSVNSGPDAGSFYIADCVPSNYQHPTARVRKVDPSGDITTVAGSATVGFGGDGKAATAAQLDCPSGVTKDAAGNLYIADYGNNRVRKVDTTGIITTVAGDGDRHYGPDGIAATASHVFKPNDVAIGPDGSLYVAEAGFGRIRRVDSSSGIITTVAGTGIPAPGGDGGPATLAQFDLPTQIAFDSGGNLLIADQANHRIRTVAAGAYPFPSSGCGEVVTKNVTLTADLGPCPYDGIDVGGDNVTINLNGHRIFSNSSGSVNDGAGVRVAQRKGVTVTGGTSTSPGSISGFGAGVALIESSGTTVTNLSVHDNFNGDPHAAFGDGIGLFYSASNQITNNTISNNGGFDGLGILGYGSDGNIVQANTVSGSNAGGTCDATGEAGDGIAMNAFLSADLPRQVILTGNQLLSNTVQNNESSGITTVGSLKMLIQGNSVLNNGRAGGCLGNGIGISPLGHAGSATYDNVLGNQVHGNAQNGIVINTLNNTIANNNVANNSTLSPGNGFDLADYSFGPGKSAPGCTTNTWTGNTWGSGGYNLACTTYKGSGPSFTAPASATASPTTASPTSSSSTVHHGGRGAGSDPPYPPPGP